MSNAASPTPSSGNPNIIAVRLSFFYIALFLAIGIIMPFWPVWMQSRGLSAFEIGLLSGLGVAAKLIANPIWAEWSDRRGQRRTLMILIALGAAISFSIFHWTFEFWPILITTVIFFFFFSPLMPLIESTTVLSAQRHHLNYGRIRLWGSLSFIVAAMAAGLILNQNDDTVIHQGILGCLCLIVLASILVPETRTEPHTSGRYAILALVKDKPLMIMLAAAALIQSSHGALNSFGSIYWLENGLSDGTIGFLWAVGVVIEVLFFIFGVALARKIGVIPLILLGGIAATLRWSFIGYTIDIWYLAVLQGLHAMSYGATHLGAILFIAERIPPSQSSSVQSLYSATVMGAGLGIVMFVSGALFDTIKGELFLVMAGLSFLGCLIIWPLYRSNKQPL